MQSAVKGVRYAVMVCVFRSQILVTGLLEKSMTAFRCHMLQQGAFMAWSHSTSASCWFGLSATSISLCLWQFGFPNFPYNRAPTTPPTTNLYLWIYSAKAKPLYKLFDENATTKSPVYMHVIRIGHASNYRPRRE